MLSIHLSVHALSYSVIVINQSINQFHTNVSAGAQNITGAYIIANYACLQALVNNVFRPLQVT